jgi:hypothetical protein
MDPGYTAARLGSDWLCRLVEPVQCGGGSPLEEPANPGAAARALLARYAQPPPLLLPPELLPPLLLPPPPAPLPTTSLVSMPSCLWPGTEQYSS